jgi:hypothetical protein
VVFGYTLAIGDITHNKCYATGREFRTAMLTFLREHVPQNGHDYCEGVTDNFRDITPTGFWIIALTGYTHRVQGGLRDASGSSRLVRACARIFKEPRSKTTKIGLLNTGWRFLVFVKLGYPNIGNFLSIGNVV